MLMELNLVNEKEKQFYLNLVIDNYSRELIDRKIVNNIIEAKKRSKEETLNCLNTDNDIYKIIDDNSIIGFVWLLYLSKDDSKYTFINDIFIHPKNQGKGYGKLTMKEIERITKEYGFNRIELAVTKTNTKAYNLYKSLDYRFNCGNDYADMLVKEI